MSTPREPRSAPGGPPLEPARVLRPRRTDALADLMREIHQEAGRYESVTLPRPAFATEDETEELPPVPAGSRTRRAARSGSGLRRAAVVVGVSAAALAGFAGALLLSGRGEAGTAAPAPSPTAATATASTAPAAATDPDGAGTLRQGDSGAEVTRLEQRLLRIPDVYKDGSTSGVYDADLTAAVARFQLWYGIRGDENGVYGDDTRRDLESRTTLGGG
ncbi:peptidoglycan-binding protein [Streptomyces sp. NPDC005423]|uniref:peptidoglycan-binding protein n=1 Tax=Streptomyces sp. NPDC005423 TaxID=3155343 RepID=UPI0033A1886B